MSDQLIQILVKSQFLKKNHGKKSSCKYFIGYNDNNDIRSLYIKLFQIIGCAKYFDSNKTKSFDVIDKLYTKINYTPKVHQNMEKNQRFNRYRI